MEERHARSEEHQPPAAVPAQASELPTGKAFVVQLSRETGAALQPFAGRVEHLASGRRVRFASVEEFLAAVARLLSGVKP